MQAYRGTAFRRHRGKTWLQNQQGGGVGGSRAVGLGLELLPPMGGEQTLLPGTQQWLKQADPYVPLGKEAE